MSVTSFMNLTLPTVSVTLGPEWATELNAALELVDSHDHSDGKGTKVKPAGMDINADLDFQGFSGFNFKSTQYDDQAVALSGASNANAVHTVAGDLYFTNGSGVAVQVTAGGSIVAAPGATTSLQFNNFAGNLSIAAGDPYVFLNFDTSASRTINLPSVSAVAAGRIYIVKDATGQSEANNITINADGSDTIDGSSSLTMASNRATWFIIGNGVDQWYIL